MPLVPAQGVTIDRKRSSGFQAAASIFLKYSVCGINSPVQTSNYIVQNCGAVMPHPYRGAPLTLSRAIGNVLLGLMLAAVVLGLIALFGCERSAVSVALAAIT